MTKEIWKTVTEFGDNYMVSSEGRVKSLNYAGTGKEGILVLSMAGKARYLSCKFCHKGEKCTKTVHVTVAKYFLGHKPNGKLDIVVDHIDDDKTNNRLSNLQLITNRENTSKRSRENFSSQFIGVHWSKKMGKWHSQIVLNGKHIFLGYFIDEIEASKAYQKKLKEISIN